MRTQSHFDTRSRPVGGSRDCCFFPFASFPSLWRPRAHSSEQPSVLGLHSVGNRGQGQPWPALSGGGKEAWRSRRLIPRAERRGHQIPTSFPRQRIRLTAPLNLSAFPPFSPASPATMTTMHLKNTISEDLSSETENK